MATHARRTASSAPAFTEPTVLINCSSACAHCKRLKPLLTQEFKDFCASLGYAVAINNSASKVTQYWKAYGRPIGVGQATPQIYAIDGEKAAGCVFWAGEVVQGKTRTLTIPPESEWTTELVEEVVGLLIERV